MNVGHFCMTNFSNRSLLLGAIYEMTLAGLSSVRFVAWQPVFALILEKLGQLREAFSDVWIKTDESGNR
jgi:hypothetical protein